MKFDAIIRRDYFDFKARMQETRVLLQEFLSATEGRRSARRMNLFRVKILDMAVTCGQGHSNEHSSSLLPAAEFSYNSSFDTCSPCAIGFYKEAVDNSSCLACPKYATTNVTGTIEASLCTCKKGYTAANTSNPSDRCVFSGQYVSEKAASEAARAVSTTVGVVVGTNIAVAVGTAVASSVSSAVAASSGGTALGVVGGGGGAASGEVAGSSGSGALSLINQVCHSPPAYSTRYFQIVVARNFLSLPL
jgi:hypothetical protein